MVEDLYAGFGSNMNANGLIGRGPDTLFYEDILTEEDLRDTGFLDRKDMEELTDAVLRRLDSIDFEIEDEIARELGVATALRGAVKAEINTFYQKGKEPSLGPDYIRQKTEQVASEYSEDQEFSSSEFLSKRGLGKSPGKVRNFGTRFLQEFTDRFDFDLSGDQEQLLVELGKGLALEGARSMEDRFYSDDGGFDRRFSTELSKRMVESNEMVPIPLEVPAVRVYDVNGPSRDHYFAGAEESEKRRMTVIGWSNLPDTLYDDLIADENNEASENDIYVPKSFDLDSEEVDVRDWFDEFIEDYSSVQILVSNPQSEYVEEAGFPLLPYHENILRMDETLVPAWVNQGMHREMAEELVGEVKSDYRRETIFGYELPDSHLDAEGIYFEKEVF